MTDSLNGKRLIFVGGSPRSGTTLMQNMLDSHPDICGGPEFLRLPDIIHLRNRLQDAVRKEWIVHYCSKDDVDTRMGMLIEDFLLPLADKYGCKFLSEKTPGNVLVFDELMELFPEAHFVNVIRDPRAIIASMLQVGKRGKKRGWNTQDFTRNILAAISHVRQCYKAGFAATRVAPDRVTTIVYENLVNDPERETKRLCEFLGLEWSAQMRYPANYKHLGEEAICNEVWYDKEMYNRNPETKEVDKWKRQLGVLQTTLISVSFRDFEELSRFGYDFSVASYRLIEYFLDLILSAYKFVLRRWPKHRFRRVRRHLLRSMFQLR